MRIEGFYLPESNMARHALPGLLGLTLVIAFSISTLALTRHGPIPPTVKAMDANKSGLSESVKVRVVIVGAGVAGFTAAATLLASNVTDLVVLEAADRVGGRIHTVKFGGVSMDVGPEFVMGEQGNAVYELATSAMLTSYLPHINPEGYVYANTSGYHKFNVTQITELTDTLYEIFEEDDLAKFNGSVADYFYPRVGQTLESLQVEGHLGEAMRTLVGQLEVLDSASDDLHQLGARGFSAWQNLPGDQLLKWRNGTRGYSTLLDLLSKKYPNSTEELPVRSKIQLNKKVTSIDRNGERVEVACEDGSRYLADHVIVTLGLGVLKAHSKQIFKQPLPDNKATAIETVGFGCEGKVFMLFPTRWWPDNVTTFVPLFSDQEMKDFQKTSKHGSWTSWTTGFYPVIQHERMMCAWFSGEPCRTVGTLTDQEVADGLMELLNKMVGNTYAIPQPEAILKSSWASNPHILGGYTFNTVQSDQHNVTRDHLAEPITSADKPVILFAGEATNHNHFGSVHGALETGRREAQRVIDYLKRQQEL